jgi:hypothetical protein
VKILFKETWMLKKKLIIVSCGIALFGFGCQPMVLRQDIPVSTNPMGADIFADGKLAGQTPGTVSLERTQNHIVTLVKENYRQEDVVITKQYQSNKVLMNAVMAGVNSGLFFKDKRMGLSSGFGSISSQEKTGEAYILVPATVSVNLTPLYASPAGVPGRERYPAGASSAGPQPPPMDQGLSTKDVLKAGIVAGAAAGASQAKPIGKNWETSSSTKRSVKPDGTEVTRKSSTSVGVSVHPAGILQAIDTLFN